MAASFPAHHSQSPTAADASAVRGAADAGAEAAAERGDAALTAALIHALGSIGGASSRRLGGLRGLFHPAAGEVPFGVVSRGGVFFKTGPDTVTKYIARGMRPLRLAGDRQPLRDYWRVPPDVLENPDLLPLWATRAIDAARQFGRRRPAKLKRRRRGAG